MKLKVGDRFRVEASESSNYGTVQDIKLYEYVIEWDHLPGKTYGYKKEEVEEVWEIVSLPKPEASDHCDHKWKRYTGLRESYKFCEICDKKVL